MSQNKLEVVWIWWGALYYVLQELESMGDLVKQHENIKFSNILEYLQWSLSSDILMILQKICEHLLKYQMEKITYPYTSLSPQEYGSHVVVPYDIFWPSMIVSNDIWIYKSSATYQSVGPNLLQILRWKQSSWKRSFDSALVLEKQHWASCMGWIFVKCNKSDHTRVWTWDLLHCVDMFLTTRLYGLGSMEEVY